MTTNEEIKKRYNRAVGYLNIMRRAAISDYVDMKEDEARKDERRKEKLKLKLDEWFKNHLSIGRFKYWNITEVLRSGKK